MWNSNSQLFGDGKVVFFGFARAALLYALNLLGLRTGQNVLVPSFICDSALSPFRHKGIDIIFYPVHEDLRIDLEQAERLGNNSTCAFLAVNYFGFPQDYAAVTAFCQDRHLILIEDNAHGFLSSSERHQLGGYGDVAICSFRKDLPVPNGAALIINNPAIAQEALASMLPPLSRPRLSLTVKAIAKALDLRLGAHLIHFWRTLQRDDTALNAAQTHLMEEFSLDSYMEQCSLYTQAVLRLLNIDHFREQRRIRFDSWREHCGGSTEAQPIWNRLPESVVPQVFPIRAAEPERYMERLRSDTGIKASRWPRLPKVVRENIGDYPPFYTRVVTMPLDGEQAMRKPACFGSPDQIWRG